MSEFKKQLETQMAVALKYNPDKDNAPVVIAAGNGYLAQKIIELANKNNVPVYQDNSTASLLSSFELGSEIPVELYQVIAEIYAYILKAGHEFQNALDFTLLEPDNFEQLDPENHFEAFDPQKHINE